MYFPMSDIIPVFLGADLNCYNFARAFHEAYGVESYAYGRYPMAPTKYSKIIHLPPCPIWTTRTRCCAFCTSCGTA